MKYASVCSGVEAATLAWMPLGWEAAWFSEIESFPCAVLAERFPGVPNLGDMTKIEVENMENGDQKFSNGNGADVVVPGGVDLLVGGTPCQGFSVAGKQDGLRDDRSVLCLTFVRLLETMRPRWFVWENVPGVFSTGGGEDFRAILRAIDEIGYSIAWRVLDAQYVRVDGFPYAVPQRRRRVFVVGHIGGWQYPAQVLFEPGCMFGDTPPRRIKRKGAAGNAENYLAASGRFLDSNEVMSCGNGQVNQSFSNEVSNTINCMHDHEIICVHGSQDHISNTEHANAVNRNNGLENVICYENHAQDCRIKYTDVSQSVTASMGTGGNNLPIIQECTKTLVGTENGESMRSKIVPAVAIAENIIGRKVENGGNGIGALEELEYTQNSSGVMCVSDAYVVRRITPVECERLMGFPDNWTKVPYKGKSADQCPDSHRYKACGNSMCVNVMRWIGMRIENVERLVNRKGKQND